MTRIMKVAFCILTLVGAVSLTGCSETASTPDAGGAAAPEGGDHDHEDGDADHADGDHDHEGGDAAPE